MSRKANNNKILGYSNTSYLHMDRLVNASLGKLTHGISPTAITYAFADWGLHLTKSPGKQIDLTEDALKLYREFMLYIVKCCYDPMQPCCFSPKPYDKRFVEPAWNNWPYNWTYQIFLMNEKWWENATKEIRGVTKHHLDVVSFAVRQSLDILSPSNYIATNPVVHDATIKSTGMNLLKGWFNYCEDFERYLKKEPPVGAENFQVGKQVAITPGKVIYKNDLMELIQYKPTTTTVHPEPILLVPAWIMKYYILDLSPENSLVKYLVDHGYTVFAISWRNLNPKDRDVRMLDYRQKGLMAALETIHEICKGNKIHAVGYCLGGTLLSIGAAHMARENMDYLKSVTFLAAQTDFEDAGELTLFVDESQVTFIEDMMWDQGVLDSKQLAGAFQLLRSKDLIWSRVTQDYLLGQRQEINDLMAWNADATRLPYMMHSQYLRQIFLDNDLAEGRYPVDNKPIALGDIRNPIFCVATTKDHISPWKSVYKLHLITNTDITFLLTSGGHNAGIISEPGHPRREYQVRTQPRDEAYIDPDKWQEEVVVKKGSWWSEWVMWLDNFSSARQKPPHMGIPGKEPRIDAPGLYVLET